MENNNLKNTIKPKIKTWVWVIIAIFIIIIILFIVIIIIEIIGFANNFTSPSQVNSNSDYGTLYQSSDKLEITSSFIPGIFKEEVYVISIPSGTNITTIANLLNATQASPYQVAIASAAVCYSNLTNQPANYINTFIPVLFTVTSLNVYGNYNPNSANPDGNSIPVNNGSIPLTSTGEYNIQYDTQNNQFNLNSDYKGNIYALYGVKPKLLQNASLGNFSQNMYIGSYYCSIYFWSFNMWSMYS